MPSSLQRLHLGVVLAAVCACAPDLQISDGARIRCEATTACPEGFECVDGTCEPRTSNQPPSVAIAPIATSTGIVTIDLRVFDAEGDATSVTVSLGQGSAARDLGLTTEVVASPGGTPISLAWDPSTLFASDAGRQSGLVVSVTPRDATRKGVTVVSEAFTFGNNAPLLSNVRLSTAGGVGSDRIVVGYDVSDDDEPVRLRRFSVITAAGVVDIALDSTHFPDGGLEGVVAGTTAAGRTLTWDSAASNLPREAGVRLELEVEDSLGAVSVPASSPVFLLDNAPRITAVLDTPEGERFLNEVGINFVVSDPNGDLVDVVAEYRVGAGAWLPATADLAQSEVTDLVPSSLAHRFVWDILADATAGPLAAPASDNDGDGVDDPPVVAFVAAVELRLSARDDGQLLSLPADLGPLAIGDDAPVVSAASIDDAKERVSIPLILDDSAADLVNIDLEFCWRADAQACPAAAAAASEGWRVADIIFGELEGVPSGEAVEHLLVWAADSEPTSISTEPQGIGQASAAAVPLRVRARDNLGTVTLYGPWFQLESGRIVVQSAPRLVGARARRLAVVGGGSPIAIDYTLVDDQGDLADIRCEFSADLGDVWQPCAEYRAPVSEGRYDLLATPLDMFGRGGVPHRFVWDPSGQIDEPAKTLLRLHATDGRGTSTVSVPLVRPVGPRALRDDGGAPLSLFGATQGGAVDFGPTDLDVRGLVSAYLDGDAALDLAVVGAEGQVRVFVSQVSDGVTTGVFAPPTSHAVGSDPVDLVAADVDGDGVVDLVSADRGSNGVSVLLGDGLGGFVAGDVSAAPTGGAAPVALAVADFNADGLSDLLIALDDPVNDVAVSLGRDAPAGLGPPVFYAVEPTVDVAAGDFDGDGLADLALLGATALWLVPGLGSGGVGNGLHDAANVETVASTGVPAALAAGDLDRRAGAELLVATSSGAALVRRDLLGALVVVPLSDFASGAPLFADLSGDGELDAFLPLAGAPVSPGATLWLGDGRGGLATPSFIREAASGGRTMSRVVAGEFAGDAAVDVVYAMPVETGQPSLRRLAGAQRGGFDDARTFVDWPVDGVSLGRSVPVRTTLSGPNAVLPVDLDSDGQLDLVAASGLFSPGSGISGTGTMGLTIFRGFGGSGSGDSPLLPVMALDTGAFAPTVLGAGDFDDDGIADIVVGGWGSGADLYVFAGGGVAVGDRTLSSALPIGGELGKVSALLVTDLDTDAIEDLVAVGDGATAYVWLGNGSGGVGDGTFTAQPNLTTADQVMTSTASLYVGYQARGAAACDVDADGDLDLVVTSSNGTSGGSLSLFLGDGDGTFAPRVDVIMSFGPTAVVCADFDGDGVFDLASTGVGAYFGAGVGGVRFGNGRQGSGDGTFAAEVSFAAQFWGNSLSAGDLDQDGTLDLASGSAWTGFRLYRGTGSRLDPFAVITTYDVSSGGSLASVRRYATAMGDFDGDQLLDVALASFAESTVTLAMSRHERREPWRRPLAVDGRGHGSVLTPGSLAPQGLDRFGAPRDPPTLTMHRAMVLPYRGEDPATSLRRALPRRMAGTEALTDPWLVRGDWHLTRVGEPAGGVGDGGFRAMVRHLFGERTAPGSSTDFDRQGLDLSSPTFAAQRGIVVALPVLSARGDDEMSDRGVRVFLGFDDLARASDVAVSVDPLASDVDAARYLPRATSGPEVYREVIASRHTWVEIPADADGDFATGSQAGRRFVVSTGPGGGREIRVLTDRLGVFWAFVAPVPLISMPTVAAADAGSHVSFAASAVAPVDTTLGTMTWTQVDGVPALAVVGSGATLDFDAPEVTRAETLTFELSVLDSAGGVGRQSVEVVIRPVAQTLSFSSVPASVPRYGLFAVGVAALNGLGQPIESDLSVTLQALGGTGVLSGNLNADIVDFEALFTGLVYTRQETITLEAQANADTVSTGITVTASEFPAAFGQGNNLSVTTPIVDGAGVIFGGTFWSNLSLDPETTLSPGPVAFDQDAFVVRLGADGAVDWLVHFTDGNENSPNYQTVSAVCRDGSGNIAVAVRFDNSVRVDSLTHSYAGNWSELWRLDAVTGALAAVPAADRIEGFADVRSLAFIDRPGSDPDLIAAAGTFVNALSFPDTGGKPTQWATGFDQGFVEIYDASTGDLSASRAAAILPQGSRSVRVFDMAALGDLLFVVGGFSGLVNFGASWGLSGTASERDAGATSYEQGFLLAIDAVDDVTPANSQFVWVDAFNEVDGGTTARSVAAFGTTVYVAGDFVGTRDFDPNAGAELATAANNDAFLASYSIAAGNYLDHVVLGGPGYENVAGLGVDSTGNLWVAATATQGADLPNLDVPAAASNVAFVASFSGSASLTHETTYAWPSILSTGATQAMRVGAGVDHVFFMGFISAVDTWPAAVHLDGQGGGSAYPASLQTTFITDIDPTP